MEDLKQNPKKYIGKKFEIIKDYLGYEKGTKFTFNGLANWIDQLYSIKKDNIYYTCPIILFDTCFKPVKEEEVNDDLINKEIEELKNRMKELENIKLNKYRDLLNHKGCFYYKKINYYVQILKINSDILDTVELTVLYYTLSDNNIFVKHAKYNLKSFLEDLEKLDKNILEIIKGE